MSIPCCVPPVSGGDPWTCFDAGDVAQCRLFGGDDARSGPEGFKCESTGGCWRCEPDEPDESMGACCLPEPILGEQDAFPSVCLACGGRPVEDPSECDEEPPPPPPVSCRRAGEDRLPEGGKRWTLDLVGTVAIGMDPEPDESVEGTSYAQGLSATLTRSVDTPNSSPEDPCGHVRGDNVMLDDGYVYTELCSQPLHGDPKSRRRTYAVLRTAEGVADLQDGYQYAVGAVRLPYWTEFMYRSSEWRCGPLED